MGKRYVSILGINFLHTTMEQMVKRVENHLVNKEKAFIVTANPEIVMMANEDKRYKSYVHSANYVVADGIGVVKASGWINDPLPERIAGFDLMTNLFSVLNKHSLSVYLLGAKEEVLDKACQEISKKYPNLSIVGSHHGYFDIHDESIRDEILQASPDLILVALGMPRQEQWIANNITYFNKGVFMGVGGSFDVLAGVVERAPEIWQKLNLEWFYRLVKQPSRWKRMLALPRFVIQVKMQKQK